MLLYEPSKRTLVNMYLIVGEFSNANASGSVRQVSNYSDAHAVAHGSICPSLLVVYV